MARVSVIVPVYNVADYVADCLASLAGQSFKDFEAIVIDDGSTDGSGALARGVVLRDPRFTVIEQENAGLSAARNAGLDRATGDYVCFLDSDDRLAPNYLERLVGAIEDSGADWVSCGIAFHSEPGRDGAAEEPILHTGMHGHLKADWKLPEGGRPERHELTDWRAVVRHYPSAWNKIYRRALIGDTRFDEGMNYEDHAFFWRYAAKTDHILRLPEALYLSTQGREGQITRDGSERVFDQFAVLERLEEISAAAEQEGGKAGRTEALSRIATRLTLERAEAIKDRARRARFVAHARDWIAARGYAYDPTLGVPGWWIDLMEGAVPVTVVVPSDGAENALRDTLASLARQSLVETEILVVPDDDQALPGSQARRRIYALASERPGVSVIAGGQGVEGARNRGLEAARGRAIVFLDAGDTLPPRALAAWQGAMRAAGAQVALAQIRMGDAEELNPGVHDRGAIPEARLTSEAGFRPRPEEVAVLHGHPSARMFDTGFLRANRLGFAPGFYSSTRMLYAALGKAQRAVWVEKPPVRLAIRPETRKLWRAPLSPAEILVALREMAADPDIAYLETGTGGGWQARLWARAVWEKMNFGQYGDEATHEVFAAEVGELSTEVPGLTDDAALDPFIGPRVRMAMGLNVPEPEPEAAETPVTETDAEGEAG